VHEHLEQFGVSVDVVYRIEVIGLNLDRLSDLLALLETAEAERGAVAVTLVGGLVAAEQRERSVRDLLRTNVHLLARKIVERTGATGEHYITSTRREYFGMLASAAGGGLLTVGTVAFKYLALNAKAPLFVEGLLASANYAVSFVLLQVFGLTLATKQPSMTAAALARSLSESHPERDLEDLVTLIARICRSQLAAALGNVGIVAPGVIAFHYLFRMRTGHSFLEAEVAEHSMLSMHALKSGTFYFAALTGVLLWLSSICGGWLDNWSVYRRLPEAIAQKQPRRLMGWLGGLLGRNMAGYGSNISLGFLLGMLPVIGRFFGLPLEVRHVTLSTGSLALAVATLGREVLRTPDFFGAVGGIAVMLCFNFGVSFTLALFVALRARSIDHAGFRLLRAVAARFFRRPGDFLLPPRAGEAVESAHA
jgi:site-specific recombinase